MRWCTHGVRFSSDMKECKRSPTNWKVEERRAAINWIFYVSGSAYGRAFVMRNLHMLKGLSDKVVFVPNIFGWLVVGCMAMHCLIRVLGETMA